MKILLLDDHKLFGESLKLLLSEKDKIDLCDYVSNTKTFWEYFNKFAYDILLIDINLKEELTGLDLIREIMSKYPSQNIVILTSYDLLNYKEIAYKIGVKDFINKSSNIDELVERLINLDKKNKKVDNNFLKDPLSKREIEVLREIVSGENKKDIAKKLYISERTLYNHISNIYEKLGAKNAIEAYNKAMEIGYINPVM